ncbi:integrase [Hydrogeniiclostridium mannosilyticum]|uniref:Integrase n=1 Tax=Hydrogeniiclostridium mannosilyticum TaxID=2764322 RepID=A0A328UH37_9FIRM|nr:tyrosine-type recombinase/integrase [Hydrogeniiclostridium mannosilyticum]RAQ30072.1 integrase [Hydrogeniiclostridium mannosilyticum]
MNDTAEIKRFQQLMIVEEKSAATIEKYLRDIRCFYDFLMDRPIGKRETIAYKEHLTSRYAPASVNSMLVALNCFLRFIGRRDCCVKPLRVQRQIFSREDKELSVREYQQLIKAAKNTRISLVIQTICGTGIRVSELQYITAEAVRAGKAVVNCKNKTRVIFIPTSIQKLLKPYMKKSGITAGTIFVTKSGKPLNRKNIWRDMKALCERAGVSPNKVFPHNLRHLFARAFYSLEKDIVRLADLLGHSSVDTTRIYTMETGNEHRCRLERVEKLLMT